MFREKGIINLLKPPGTSSFGAIGRLKKLMDHPKAGHTGTLDPRASGVLPVCFGRATKVIPYLPEAKKEYIGEFTLGKTTNTLDKEGELVSKDESWKELSIDEIRDGLDEFVGEIEQIPPMYSAIKHNGKRLYKLARKGEKIKRKARSVTINSIELISVDLPLLRVKIGCSRGTYIRSLARDIGEKLGCGAYLSFLIRTKSGPFSIKNAVTYKMIESKIKEDQDDFIFSIDWPLVYPEIFVEKRSDKKAVNGAALILDDLKKTPENLEKSDRFLVYSSSRSFVSINEFNGKKFKPLRVFA